MTYYGTDEGLKTPVDTLVPYDRSSPVIVLTDVIPTIALWKVMHKVQHTNGIESTTYGLDGTPVQSNLRTSFSYPSVQLEFSKELDAAVVATAKTKFKTRLTNLSAAWDIISYPVGSEFVQHHDSGYFDGNKVITTQNRKISAVLYVNSQGDGYLGGDIEFPFFADSHTGEKLTIHPKSGMLAIFPSNYAFSHVVKPVTAGMRVCAVKFFS